MTTQNQVIGRGKLYFQADGDTGEAYFGNTPELSLSQSPNVLKHYSSDEGVKVLDASVTLQKDETAKFKCDNISAENLGRWFLGSSEGDDQVLDAGPFTEDVTVKKGRWFQLGVTTGRPEGLVGLNTITADDASSDPITMDTNFLVDAVNGRVFVLDDAADVADGDVVTFSYAKSAVTKDRIISGRSVLYGSLRFISANPSGKQKNFFWPRVALSSDGDFSLKGDTWQEVSFSADVLLRDTDTPSVIGTAFG